MDFEFTKEQEQFRQEVRNFLEEEKEQKTFTPAHNGWSRRYSPEFTRKVAEKGWIGLNWPKEYGGQGRSHVESLIFYEEMLRYGAPLGLHFFSAEMDAPLIIAYGNEEMKRELLPKMARGEVCFAMATCEPESGYDSPSMKTIAVDDGDDLIINGQKVWTSHGHHSTIIAFSVKTDPQATRLRRTSRIYVDTNTPGISIRPLRIVSGDEPFSEVFLDNVRVPKKRIVGERGYGSKVRSLIFPTEWGHIMRILGFQCIWDELIRFCRETKRDGVPLCKDPLVRSKIAQIEIEREVGRLLSIGVADALDKGRDILALQAPVVKAYGAFFHQRQAEVLLDILGLYGQLNPSPALGPTLAEAASAFWYSKGDSLRGDPIEALLSRIAEVGLGLPSYLGVYSTAVMG